MKTILGKKLGMTQIFTEHAVIPVTVVEAGPVTVTQIKTVENDGYDAVQFGFEDAKPQRVNKPMTGHFAKNDIAPKKHLAEFRPEDGEAYEIGQQITVADFEEGKKEGIVRPTLAGLMALGRFPQRYFPRACLSFTVIPGTSKADVSAEGLRFLDSREIVGPIPVMISELMVALRRNVRVSSKVEGAFRIDRLEYPETAVREAVANALMHRDYSPDGCASQVQVTMYGDRIEILSPGGLCRAMTVDRLGELGVSFPRNQALANILRATPYAEGFAEVGSVVENKGTGYFQIRASLREANMPEPVAIDHITAFEVALYKAGAGAEAGRFGFGFGGRAGGGGRGGVRLPEGAAGGKIVRSVTEWSDETGRFHTIHVLAPGTVECDIVDFLEEAPAPVSSRILMDALGKSKATISRALNRLMDKSLVERLGPSRGPGAVYRLVQ